MRIAIVSDAWEPQVNGVVNTIKNTRHSLLELGHDVLLVTPENCRTFACPTYPEIRLAYKPYAKVEASLHGFAPDCIHIATEGPMGLAARRYCLNRGLNFTTAYHTRFPEYLRSRGLMPLALSYRWLRWFHGPSKAVMVATPRVMSRSICRAECRDSTSCVSRSAASSSMSWRGMIGSRNALAQSMASRG